MTETHARSWHNIRPNETTRLPRRYVFLDSEARSRRVHKGHEQTWRLAVASFVSGDKGRARTSTMVTYHDADKLWEDVTSFCKAGARTILWAHNLGYDIRITQSLEHLPAMGWKLTAHNISKGSSWLEWQREGMTLLMADSASIYNTTIAKVGVLFGLGKVEVDPDEADDCVWEKRCVRDVEILQRAVLEYLDWLESDDMGNWQITSAAQSWATFRHKFLTHKMVVHDDEEALKAERRAMWSGRCEAYWHGGLKGQTIHEWDFTQAYAQIARDNAVPVRLLGPMPSGYDWRSILGAERTALLAECVVDTPVPVVPTQRDGRTLWPVGTFTTTLWDVEIEAVLRAGGTVEVTQGWLYQKRPALKAWAEWIISQLDASEHDCPTWRKQILKHWSRALIGRLAMTYNNWESYGEAPDSKVQRAVMYDMDTKESCDVLQVGTDVWIDTGRTESPNSMPMITGYVQAIARVMLWNVLQAVPDKIVLYIDTDSLLCTARNSKLIARAARELGYANLRLKRSWDGFCIYGPRQIVTGRQVRTSGIPHTARQVARTKFEGDLWESLPGALRGGHIGSVVIRDRRWEIRGVDHRRRGIGIGFTTPIVVP